MKTLLLFLAMIFCASAQSQTYSRKAFEQLLLKRGTSIVAFEAQGLQLIMGERSGGGKNLKFASVEVFFTSEEAILKDEIENVNLPHGNRLGNLESLQAAGRHIEGAQIIGVMVK